MDPAANPAPAPARRSRVGARSFRIHRKDKKSGAEMNAIRNGQTANVLPRSKWTRLCEPAETRLIAARISIMSKTAVSRIVEESSLAAGRPQLETQRTASGHRLAQNSSRTQNADL